MLIKHKLIINTIVTIVGMLAMLLLMNFSSSSLQKDITLAQNIGKIEAGILQLRSHEKDFLARKKSEYIQQFNSESAILQSAIKQLSIDLEVIDISADESIKLSKALTQYQKYFTDVVATQKRIGFDPQSGLNGQLAKAVKEAEVAIGNSISFLNMMLTVSSSEKNYIHLLDDKYVKSFQESFAPLHKSVKKSYLTSTQKKAILKGLDSYNSTFLALVKEQKKLGYHAHDGLQKSLNDSAAQVQKIQASLVTKTNTAVSAYVDSISNLTYLLFSVALLISIAIGWILSRSIMTGILYIKNAIVKISETNDLTVSLTTDNNDELADVAKAFNSMMDNFQHLIISVNNSGSLKWWQPLKRSPAIPPMRQIKRSRQIKMRRKVNKRLTLPFIKLVFYQLS